VGVSSSFSIATPRYETLRTTCIISCMDRGSLPRFCKRISCEEYRIFDFIYKYIP
jgi:hypothetical protein